MAADKLPNAKNFEPGKDLDMSVKAILCKNGVVLLLKNEKGWDLPGGHVRQGENIISALMREIFEETGIKVADVQDLHMQHGNKIFFKGKFLSDDIILSDEHSEYNFFNLDEIKGLEGLSSEYRKAIYACLGKETDFFSRRADRASTERAGMLGKEINEQKLIITLKNKI